MREITSLQNPHYKALLKLRDKRGRDSAKLFLVEGLAEIKRALSSDFELSELVYSDCEPSLETSFSHLPPKTMLALASSLYKKLALREENGGYIGVFKQKKADLEHFLTTRPSLILILEDLEKPGNLGAICRSSVGAGVDGIFVLGKSVDIFNPNAIRASLGAIFQLPIFQLSHEQALDFCQKADLSFAVAALGKQSKTLWDYDFSKNTAIVMGNEHGGVSKLWLDERRFPSVLIPMASGIDSLNVSVASALIVYEVRRQRSL